MPIVEKFQTTLFINTFHNHFSNTNGKIKVEHFKLHFLLNHCCHLWK